MLNAVIHVIDDDASMREALHRLLGTFGFEVRLYESAGDFLLSWPVDIPGCLLLDVRMPGPSGLDLQRALAQRADALPVVFLTGYGDIAMSVLAIKRGAVDFLTKPVYRDVLLAAVTAALECDAARREDNRRQRDLRQNFAALTAREREVFSQVVVGRLNKQIAAALNTCERTVKAHRAHVMEKMHARSVAELVQIALRLEMGLVPGNATATLMHDASGPIESPLSTPMAGRRPEAGMPLAPKGKSVGTNWQFRRGSARRMIRIGQEFTNHPPWRRLPSGQHGAREARSCTDRRRRGHAPSRHARAGRRWLRREGV